MSVKELKTIASLAKSGWKQLALADIADASGIRDILVEILEGLDEIEAEATGE